MNKNLKILKLQGFSGLLLLFVLMIGLFGGFIAFPVWALMMGWNELVGNVFNGPVINYIQASLLWLFIALSCYLVLKNSISIKFQQVVEDELDSEEMNEMFGELPEHQEDTNNK